MNRISTEYDLEMYVQESGEVAQVERLQWLFYIAQENKGLK